MTSDNEPADRRFRRLSQPDGPEGPAEPSKPPSESEIEHAADDLDHPDIASSATTLKRIPIDERGMPILNSAAANRARRQRPPRPESGWPDEDPSAETEPVALPTVVSRRRRPVTPRRVIGWAGRALFYALIAAIFIAAGGFIGLTVGYFYIASDLPPIGDLRARASQFETARVYDASGNLLYEIVDPKAGRRTYVPLASLSPYVLAATIATEDQNFYAHPGFDPVGILRAIVQNLEAGDTVSGASTITQQLVRALVLSPEERAQRTNLRKIREIILAAEITRRYTKDEILELYLNEIYYGNLAYGIEAAAETYFNKQAGELTLAEAAFLAGLPQAPAVYDVFSDPETAFARQQQVLGLMLTLGEIPISTQINPVRVTLDDVRGAMESIRRHNFVPPRSAARFPHWVNYVRQLLEEQYGAESLYRSGWSIYTTLDPDLQAFAEQTVLDQVSGLADRNVTNGALVALRPATGEIVAMVGSDNYDDPTDGQINMAIRPRQPGSSIKPLTYALAFERGWTPATLIWDVPTEFPDGANPPYVPVNYDGRFHGGVTVRTALANSYNVPAVKALEVVGLRQAGGFIPFAETLGISSLTRDDYGLSLTLGGGEVPLVEMVEAYGALATGGRRVFPIAIRRITDSGGQAICEQPFNTTEVRANPPACQAPPDNWTQEVMSPETAYQISDILTDNAARTPAFGPNSTLRLPFPAAAKTGTTNDVRDNWTIGYTPDLVVGVWVGNADFTPMRGTSGLTGAAPIWRAVMEHALAGKASWYNRPQNIVERLICAISGAEPSDFCPPDQRRPEIFAASRLPLPATRDLWQSAFIDPFSKLYQTAECAAAYQFDLLESQRQTVIAVSDPFARKWLTEDPNGQAWALEHGIIAPIAWAPEADCTLDAARPIISIAFPPEGATLNPGVMEILGQAAATKDFDHFIIEYGLSHDPLGWGLIQGPNTNSFPSTGQLAVWDASQIQDGPIAIRVVVFSTAGGRAEARVKFNFERPTPTPEPTGTATSTPTVTPTPTITPTPTVTPTPSVTSVSTATPTPSSTFPPTASSTFPPTPPIVLP